MQLVDHASKSVRSTRTPRTQSGCLTTSGAIGQVIVLFRDRQPMYLDEIDEGADLIRVLARSNSPHQENDGTPNTLGCVVDRVTWASLVSEFQPSMEFLQRAIDHLGKSFSGPCRWSPRFR